MPRSVEQSQLEVLDSFRVPLILADRRRRLLHANPAAARLIAGGELLCVRDGQLGCAQPESNAELAVSIEEMLQSDSDPCEHRKRHVFSLTRRDGGRVPAVMLCLRHRSAASVEAMTAYRVLVCVVQAPDATPELPVLQRIFGLTRAEARLAASIAAGTSPIACARDLNVKISTVRSQLNSVFRKTGVRTQSQLVALMLSLVLL